MSKMICIECKSEVSKHGKKLSCQTAKCPNKGKELTKQSYMFNGNEVYDYTPERSAK